MSKKKWHLFEGYGIELEYMIVDQDSLQTKPICDLILKKMANGKDTMSVKRGEVGWSNELALHVIELKSSGPKKDLVGLQSHMQEAINEMNHILNEYKASLLATGMHPFFDPDHDSKLWHAEDAVIYSTYDRIFSCKGHGWTNLQSIHINLPFFDDSEFGKLHTAIRLVLPLIPSIAASTPIVQGAKGPLLDSRVGYYLKNQKKVASIIGLAIPEQVLTRRQYTNTILKPMYKDIEQYDPEKVLAHEWLNSRAAIARFMRHAIEIRLTDIQECLSMDFCLIATITALVEVLVNEKLGSFNQQSKIPTENLRKILDGVLLEDLEYKINDLEYLKTLGIDKPKNVREIWQSLIPTLATNESFNEKKRQNLELILKHGTLAKRILHAVGNEFNPDKIRNVYKKLKFCLASDTPFQA